MEADAYRAMMQIVTSRGSNNCVVYSGRRALMSHGCLLITKKCVYMCKVIGGVIRYRVTVASFNENRKFTFLPHKHQW